jgi:hypothetical protein
VSGDVYLYFAKAAKAVPQEATKDSHGAVRNIFKSAVLGIGYGMKAKGLAERLTAETGKFFSVDAAQDIIDPYDSTFSDYAEWKAKLLAEYKKAKGACSVRLADGWRMWGDNPNLLSVGNVPIQGFGSVAMRKAVAMMQDAGLDVIFTLHDCIYAEVLSSEWRQKMDVLCECMRAAFAETVAGSFGGKMPKHYVDCRSDPKAWGENFAGDCDVKTEKGNKVHCQRRYMDERMMSKNRKVDREKWDKIVFNPIIEGLDI